MHFARFPRVHLAHLPTPLEPMDRLSKHLGGPQLWIKRDDCTGLSTGGNKTRKLEFLIGEALAKGADTVITQGATQSNHARQTAAGPRSSASNAIFFSRTAPATIPTAYTMSGNVLLDRLHGASLSKRPGGADMNAEMEALAADLRDKGRKPYVIPGGGSNPVGALGYANCALELLHQANEMGLKIDHIVHATGSAGTQAGFVAGTRGAQRRHPRARHLGARAEREAGTVGVRSRGAYGRLFRREGHHEARAYRGQQRLCRTRLRSADGRHARSGEVGGAFRGHSPGSRLHRQRLDGLVDHVEKGFFPKDGNVVFLHTGGSAGLFGYPDAFDLPGYA